MSKIPRITGDQAKSAFGRAGFVEVRRKRHCIMKKEGHPYRLSIPMHKGKTLGKGLLKSLIDAAGLTLEEFKELL